MIFNGVKLEMAENVNFDGVVFLPLWHQGDYYNAYCPWNFSTGSRSVTGCVATAAAQVVWYWLARGYTDDINITLTDEYSYWYYSVNGDICYVIDSSLENAQQFGYVPFETVNAILADENIYTAEYIAALNFSVGVMHGIVYDDWGGAAGGFPSDLFFGDIGMNYANAGMSHCVDYVPETDSFIITDEFYEILIDNLLAGCPVITVNYNHAYVIDGYNSTYDIFHVNWGDGTGGAWHTRNSLHTLGNEGFVYDIMPQDYIEVNLTVTDSDYYGRGTFMRAVELANVSPGINTISFDLKGDKREYFESGDSTYFVQSCESLIIDSMDWEISVDCFTIFAQYTGIRDEEVFSLTVNDFSGIIIARA